MGVLWALTKTGIKVGLVVGAVKLSIDHNVWSLNTKQGSELYEEFKKYIVPGTIVYREKLPTKSEVQLNVASKWNDNVNCVFGVLNELPSRTVAGVNALYRSTAQQIRDMSAKSP